MLDGLKKVVTGFFSSRNTRQDPEPVPDIYEKIEDPIQQKQIVSEVYGDFEKRRQERIAFELQWQLNMNFLLGNQYCDINMYSESIIEQERMYDWQEREVFNHIAPIVETRLAKLGRVNPAMRVRPATSDLEDISSAKTSTAIVKSSYRKQNMQKEIGSATAWSEICGTVLYKPVWNPAAGKLIAIFNGNSIYEGDISTYVCPPFEIFPDSNYADDVDKCRSIIHARAYHADEVDEIWNRKVHGNDIDVFSLTETTIGLGGLGYTANVPMVASTIKKDHVVVLEKYEMPSKQYPMGRLIICTKDELLHYGPLPYINGEDGKRVLPFIRQVCIEHPGCFWGISIIERLIPIQRAYNAVKNRKHEFLNRVAVGILAAEEGSMDMEDLQEEGLYPGKILTYRQGGQAPTMLNYGDIPPEFAMEEDKLSNEFILISGVSELSRNSAAPTGAGSGVALEILREQDDTRLSLTAEHIRIAILDLAKMWIRLYKQFVVGLRLDRLVGESNSTQAITWSKNDLSSDDIIHETENELAQTPAQRKQTVYDLIGMGLFNDPETGALDRRARAKILETLDLGNWEAIDDMDELHINRAQRENMMLEQGEAPEIKEIDNDDIHIQEHTKYMLSGDYEELPDDGLKQEMEIHLKLHEQSKRFKDNAMQTQAMADQMQQQQMIQGGTIQ